MRKLSEAQKRSLARMRGEYVDPPPTKTKKASRFMPAIRKRPRELAVRNAEGSKVGPR